MVVARYFYFICFTIIPKRCSALLIKLIKIFFLPENSLVSCASIDKKNFTTIFLKEKLSRFTVFAIYVSKII